MNQKVKKLRQILVAVVILAAVAGFTSCEKYKILPFPFDPNATWSFKNDIQPIFINDKCIDCHNGTRSPDLRQGNAYNSLTNGGYVNAPGVTSRIYVRMNSQDHLSRSSETDRLKVLNWIDQGAKNN
jgi:hypothetical protein